MEKNKNIEEKKLSEDVVKENEKVENPQEEQVEQVEQEEVAVKLFVSREQFIGENYEKYWSYCLKGEIRGRSVKICFIPRDKNGYAVLDILFDVSDKAELVIKKEVSVDATGKKKKYTSYILKTIDEDGMVYDCPVKPAKDSDKSFLKMILRKNGIEIY